MKKNIRLVLLLLAVAFLCLLGINYYNSNRPLDRATEGKIDRLMADSMQKYHAPGMIVGIWVPGRGKYVRAAGVADIGTGRAMRITDSYRIGSLTKTFTATLALQLIDEGKLGLEDTLDKYVASVPNAKNITIRQLLNMTSGLHSYTEVEWVEEAFLKDRFRGWTSEKLVAAAVAAGPDFSPGKGFHYSNTNYVLLGMIVEKLTGQKLADAYKSRIIDRLGLKNTFYPKDNKLYGEYCRGYMFDNGKWEDWTEQNVSWGWAAGGLISDLSDVKRYIKALNDGSLLGQKLQRERETSWVEMSHSAKSIMTTLRYGLGVFKAGGFVGHNGALPGYVNLAVYDPASGATIAFMLNAQPAQGDATLQIFKSAYEILFPEVKI